MTNQAWTAQREPIDSLEMDVYENSDLTATEVAEIRELVEVNRIQKVMLRYVRGADRGDIELMRTTYWEDSCLRRPRASDSGAVFVRESPAWFECTMHQRIPAGDHDIVVFRVGDRHIRSDLAPLVFHGSGYRTLT